MLSALKSDQIFDTLDYRRKKEAYIAQYMHQPLLARLEDVHRTMSPSASDMTIRKKAKASLLWEGDVNTTINHVRFLGAQHRPDFVVDVDKQRIAVEIKRLPMPCEPFVAAAMFAR